MRRRVAVNSHPRSNLAASPLRRQAGRHSVTATADSPTGGTLILTDLDWKGWQVEIDGSPGVPSEFSQKFRPYRTVMVPAGKHTIVWTYRPQSVLYGGMVSAATLVFLIVIASSRRFGITK